MVEARTSAELASLQVATESPFGAYRFSVQKGIGRATVLPLACTNVTADETGRFINRVISTTRNRQATTPGKKRRDTESLGRPCCRTSSVARCLVARFSYCPRIILIAASDSNVCDRTLDLQRPADYIVGRHVEQKLAEIGEAEGSGKQLSAAE